jgi:glyoxylase-like metal-dependent hydrolase (beta-lactamase superfamily II)
MSENIVFDGPIFQTHFQMAPWAPLNVYLVKGSQYAVMIDSGIQSLYPQLVETMERAGVADADLKFILHTHSHHDHIGSNAQLKARTGCLIAAPSHYAAWHADFEQHYQTFARPFPHLMPDTEALRTEVFEVLDAPAPLDLFVDEGTQFNLGGGVSLRAYSLPGHLLAELGWFEESTRTFILGDAVTMLEGPFFHSHLSVSGYRHTLDKLARLLDELRVEWVLMAHFAPMRPAEVRDLIAKAHAYVDEIEATMIKLIATEDGTTLEQVWRGTCQRLGRKEEFRALNMVDAHIKDLLERGVIREVEHERYAIR